MAKTIKNIVHNVLKEEISRQLNEGFKSNKMRQFFKQHGGVKKVYTYGEVARKPEDVRGEMNDEQFQKYSQDYEAKKNDIYDYTPQNALGDVNDEDIVYMQEFPNNKEAFNHSWQMNHPPRSDGGRHRNDRDTYYTVYQANDGTCLVVGLDKKRVPVDVTWGGYLPKKQARRYWNNDENSRYKDDSDTYYYGRKANNFGVRTNHGYQLLKKNNAEYRKKMTQDEFDDYIKDRIQMQKDFIRRHYPPYDF